jgi:hypothetical protein
MLCIEYGHFCFGATEIDANEKMFVHKQGWVGSLNRGKSIHRHLTFICLRP